MSLVIGFFTFIIWFSLCFVVASGAENRGHSYIAYLLLSIFLSPLTGAFILFVLGNKTEDVNSNTETSDYKKCPFCAELIKKEAIICRFCGRELPNEIVSKSSKQEISTDISKTSNSYTYDKIPEDIFNNIELKTMNSKILNNLKKGYKKENNFYILRKDISEELSKDLEIYISNQLNDLHITF